MTVDQLPQAETFGERGRQEQTRVGHQAAVVEGDGEPGRGCSVIASNGCSLFPVDRSLHDHSPDSEEHPIPSLRDCIHALLRCIRGKKAHGVRSKGPGRTRPARPTLRTSRTCFVTRTVRCAPNTIDTSWEYPRVPPGGGLSLGLGFGPRVIAFNHSEIKPGTYEAYLARKPTS